MQKSAYFFIKTLLFCANFYIFLQKDVKCGQKQTYFVRKQIFDKSAIKNNSNKIKTVFFD